MPLKFTYYCYLFAPLFHGDYSDTKYWRDSFFLMVYSDLESRNEDESVLKTSMVQRSFSKKKVSCFERNKIKE